MDQMEDYKKGTHLRSKDKIRQLVRGWPHRVEWNNRGRPHNTRKARLWCQSKEKKSGNFLILSPEYSILFMKLFLQYGWGESRTHFSCVWVFFWRQLCRQHPLCLSAFICVMAWNIFFFKFQKHYINKSRKIPVYSF